MGLGRDLLYAAAAILSAPAWVPWALARGHHRSSWRGRWGDVAVPQPQHGPRVLVHAVSVGEVSSVTGLLPTLHEAGFDCVVSSTTDTGLAQARALYGERWTIVQFPFDWSRAVARFLDRVQPDVVALVELELWPNFVEACLARGIRVVVISGRISERSAPRYARLRPLLGSIFARLTAVGAQTETYAARFRAMGTPQDRITVTDSLKWDAAIVEADPGSAAELGRELGIDPGRPLVVAGSTGPGEEVMLAQDWPADVQLLVAPRKPERFDEVAAALPSAVRRSDKRSDRSLSLEAPNLFLLDSIGELQFAYSLADVAILGRSFNGMGGSNPIEPAALGCPVLVGPNHNNFIDTVSALQAGRGLEIASSSEIRERAVGLARDADAAHTMGERARAVVEGAQGATQRTVALIERVLAGPP